MVIAQRWLNQNETKDVPSGLVVPWMMRFVGATVSLPVVAFELHAVLGTWKTDALHIKPCFAQDRSQFVL